MVYILLIVSFGFNYVLYFQRERYAAEAQQAKEKEAKTFSKYMNMFSEYTKLKKETEKL